MQKRLLIVVVLLVFSVPLKAQLLEFSKGDTILSSKQYPTLFATTYLTTQVDFVVPQWKVTKTNLPSSWEVVSLCDNVLCYFAPIPTESTMDTIKKTDGATENKLEFTLDIKGDYDSIGVIELEVTIPDSNYTKTLYYIFSSYSLSVNEVKNDEPSAWAYKQTLFFKNPTSQSVYYSITNYLGQSITNQSLAPNTSTQLSLKSGVYFVQFLSKEKSPLKSQKILMQQ
jgi:hypothetical protein